MTDPQAALSHLDANTDATLERLFQLIRMESISTDPAYAGECRKTAEWHAADLGSFGFTARVADTPGHPIVVAHHDGPGPHVLFYGHYDVQPVDPLELWTNGAPFEPAVQTRNGIEVIHGRGAADDKGQTMTFVEACRALIATTGSLPCKVTILLEGEEESGGESLPPFLEANRDELTGDIALICDTGMWDAQTPAITTMLRGNVADQVTVHAASRDLHSGMYGGAAANPIHVLTRLLAGMHDDTGRITIPNFYDGVHDLPQDIRNQWQELGFSPEKFLGDVGLSDPWGKHGYSALEHIWSRPTAEVNGIWGGYTGEGFKTVIPAEAHAKVSFPPGRRPGSREDPRGLPRLRSGPPARRLSCQLQVPWRRRRHRDAAGQSGLPAGPSGTDRGMGPGCRLHRLRRLDPGGGRAQESPGDGFASDRLRPRGRQPPLAEREVQSDQLSEGCPVLGPRSLRPGRLIACGRIARAYRRPAAPPRRRAFGGPPDASRSTMLIGWFAGLIGIVGQQGPGRPGTIMLVGQAKCPVQEDRPAIGQRDTVDPIGLADQVARIICSCGILHGAS